MKLYNICIKKTFAVQISLNGVSVCPESKVGTAAMLVLLMVEN
jgi:hypothetical protein